MKSSRFHADARGTWLAILSSYGQSQERDPGERSARACRRPLVLPPLRPRAGHAVPSLARMSAIKRRASKSEGAKGQIKSRRHRRALERMAALEIPFLVGGGHALRHYTGDVRGTKDLDVFVRRGDALAFLEGLAAAGFDTDLTFPHWLGKAHVEGDYIDVIYSSGNGLAEVDEDWFAHSRPARVLGVPVRLCPPEVMIGLCRLLEREACRPASDQRVCQGTLLSREQYLTDVSRWGYADGRLMPRGSLTPEEIAQWTAAIEAPREIVNGPRGDDHASSSRR